MFWVWFILGVIRVQASSSDSDVEEDPDLTTKLKQMSLKTMGGLIAEFAFDKVYDGMRCDNLAISNMGSRGFTECKQRCLDNDVCEYMVFYPRSKIKLCELFENCDPVKTDEKVSVFKKVTPCHVAVESYLQMISIQFPTMILRYEPPNQNLYCHCTLPFWMLCVALVAEGSVEASLLRAKLNPKRPKMMAPFFQQSGMTIFSVESPPNAPRIFAELQVWPRTRCLRRDRCVSWGPNIHRCPVMETQFKAGQIVFILKEDDPKALRDLPVKCISVAGISSLSSHPSAETNGGFRDPYGRYSDLFFTELNYTPYIIFNEADFLGSYCVPPEFQVPPPPPPGGPSSPGPSQPEVPSVQAPEPLSKGQKKKLKKQLSASSPATSGEGTSSQHAQAPRDSFSGSEGFSPDAGSPIPGVTIGVRPGSRLGTRHFYAQLPSKPTSGSPPALLQPPLQRSNSAPTIDASALEARESLSSDLSELDDIDEITHPNSLDDIDEIGAFNATSPFLHSKIILIISFLILTSFAFLHQKNNFTSNRDLYIEFIA